MARRARSRAPRAAREGNRASFGGAARRRADTVRAELDPTRKLARVDVALALGKDVSAHLARAPATIAGLKLRLAAAVALEDGVRVDGTSLDVDAARELAREVAASELGRLEAFALDLRRDRVVLEVPAPREADSWRAIEKGLVVLTESWSRRFSSYR
jgi:hypothetical protein